MKRRLAAIFCADVAGYARLMSTDEDGTLCLLNAHREIMDRQITQHGGRTANTAGDSIVAEFPSAVDAVRCAIDIQERLAALNEDIPKERRVIFRIGVHVGEIMVRSAHGMSRYVGDAPDPFVDGWLRTGDLGYLSDGELFVTGRSKEVIISLGHNYHPEDIERAASAVPGAAPGGCVAFNVPGAKEGEFAIVVEATIDAADDLAARIRQAVAVNVGVAPRFVEVVPVGSVPRTANGKLRRIDARDAFVRGDLADT